MQFYAKENPLLSVTIHNHPLNYGPVTFPHTSSLHGGNSEESSTVLTHYFIFFPFVKKKSPYESNFCKSFSVGHVMTVCMCMSMLVMSELYACLSLSCHDCM